MDGQAADVLRLLGWPTRPEVVAVRDDARAGPQVAFERRQQFIEHARQEKHRDDGCRAEVSLEQVAVYERDTICHARFRGVGGGLGDEPAFDLDADAARAVSLRRRDWNPAVPRPQVVDDVGGCHVRQFEHRVDDALRRRHVPDAGLRQPLRLRGDGSRTSKDNDQNTKTRKRQ